MHRTLRSLGAALLLALAAAATVLAVGQGRLLGTVLDEASKPIPGVKVTITSPEMGNFKVEKTTDSRGQISVIIIDSTRAYRVRLEKEGFAPFEGPLQLKLEDTAQVTWTLAKPSAAGPSPEDQAKIKEIEGKNKAIEAYNAGVKALNAKDFATASTSIEEAFTIDPAFSQAHPEAQDALAYADYSQGKHREALAAVDKFLVTAPKDKHALQLRYDILHASGDKQQSAQALDDLAAVDPGRDTALRIYNEGSDAFNAHNQEISIQRFKRALEMDPKLDAAYTGLTNSYMRAKDFKQALAVADHWIEVNGPGPEAFLARYRALAALKDPRAKEAKAALDQQTKATAAASGTAKTPEDAYNQGVHNYNAGNMPDATAAFESALKLRPDFGRAHYMLALCYANANRVPEAREHLEAFIKLAPNDPDAKSAQEMLKDLH